MNESHAAAQTLMACLGEESRFRLVQALIGGARCVTDLASEVGLSQSCTTRHLQALESRRVVSGRRDGKRVLYRIRDDDPGLLPLLQWALDRPADRVVAMANLGSVPNPGDSAHAPGSDPEVDDPQVHPEPQPARRGGGSEIEDYLL